MGTTVSQMPSAPNHFSIGSRTANGLENGMAIARNSSYGEAHTNGDWSSHPHDGVEVSEHPYPASGRAGLSSQYNGQVSVTQDGTVIYDREDQIAAAEAAHRQEQRGVSNLSHVASAIASNGATNHMSMAQVSPTGGQMASIGPVGMNNPGSVLASGGQMGLEKRGPVEFNHAIGYVNKIKVISAAIICIHLVDPLSRTDSLHIRTSTNHSWKSYRLISESRNLSRTSTLK